MALEGEKRDQDPNHGSADKTRRNHIGGIFTSKTSFRQEYDERQNQSVQRAEGGCFPPGIAKMERNR